MGSTDPKGEAGRIERLNPDDVVRLPLDVRQHFLLMVDLAAEARAARKRWTDLRDEYKRWQAGNTTEHREPIRSFEVRPVFVATMRMWDAERAQEQAAAKYREQLAENNARPVGSRWSPTVLAAWARAHLAAKTPA